MAAEGGRFDPLLMAVLSRRLEAIIREMSNTVMRASRSAVITNARDMSCGILTYDHRLICVEEAMPIHVSALVGQPVGDDVPAHGAKHLTGVLVGDDAALRARRAPPCKLERTVQLDVGQPL